jgi:hypothetical protein
MMNWISTKDRLPKFSSVVRIKKSNGDEAKAYFHADAMAWVKFYGIKSTYFQDHESKKFLDLDEVTHWSSKEENL